MANKWLNGEDKLIFAKWGVEEHDVTRKEVESEIECIKRFGCTRQEAFDIS